MEYRLGICPALTRQRLKLLGARRYETLEFQIKMSKTTYIV